MPCLWTCLWTFKMSLCQMAQRRLAHIHVLDWIKTKNKTMGFCQKYTFFNIFLQNILLSLFAFLKKCSNPLNQCSCTHFTSTKFCLSGGHLQTEEKDWEGQETSWENQQWRRHSKWRNQWIQGWLLYAFSIRIYQNVIEIISWAKSRRTFRNTVLSSDE